ncbi:hypothetical protein [Paenarthrobacter sp. Z7-10]|uniref:hypothetical protein n=1 Tax=Paenarthrobacter sp. Z7-10 TaxID=2787635 RepID=UPI0022A9848E|nr:hypothetical protein [Paenarthrobacter sp. Z7-10]
MPAEQSPGAAVVLLAGAELLGVDDAVALAVTEAEALGVLLSVAPALSVLLASGAEATASTEVEPVVDPEVPLQPVKSRAEAATVTKSDRARGRPKLFMTTACWEVLLESTPRPCDS